MDSEFDQFGHGKTSRGIGRTLRGTLPVKYVIRRTRTAKLHVMREFRHSVLARSLPQSYHPDVIVMDSVPQ